MPNREGRATTLAASPSQQQRDRRVRDTTTNVMAIDTSVPLSPKTLGDHLWESENRTRNKISNPKDYVLALLFFKRACDRYAEETAAALDDLADVPDAMEIIAANPNAYHDLLIPYGCFWSDVRNTDEDRLGQAMNDALLGISNANPEQLHGVFETIDFNNKRAIPPEALADLLDHFETLGSLTDELPRRPSRPGVRVDDRQIRRSLRQAWRGVLHAGPGRKARREAARARTWPRRLRPHLRLGRTALTGAR